MTIGTFSNFNLSNFQAEVLGKGLARVNRFEVIIPRPKLLNQRSPQKGFNGAIIGGDRIATSTIPPQRISLLCEAYSANIKRTSLTWENKSTTVTRISCFVCVRACV